MGLDLQSRYERYLTEKRATKPSNGIFYPKVRQILVLAGRTVDAMGISARGVLAATYFHKARHPPVFNI